jgi:hypothetical protein
LLALSGGLGMIFSLIGRGWNLPSSVPEFIAQSLARGTLYVVGAYIVERFTLGPRVCVKTRVWHWPGWTPACAGVTALDLGAVFRPVIPAKAGIHEFSNRLFSPAQPQKAPIYRGATLNCTTT